MKRYRNTISFECPECGSSYFGTIVVDGEAIRSCHGDYCDFRWHVKDDWKYFVYRCEYKYTSEEDYKKQHRILSLFG